MTEPTSRRKRTGWVLPPGPRRVLACLVATGAIVTTQGVLPSAALASTVDATSSPTATATATDPTPTSSPLTDAEVSTASISTTATGAPTTGPARSSSSSRPAPAPPGDGEDALTSAQVAAQVAQARRLRGALAAADASLAALGQQLAEAAVKAAAALERTQQAELHEQEAKEELHNQLRQLAQTQAEAATSAQDMAQWARNAYVAGGEISSYEGWMAVLQKDAVGDTSHDLAVLEHLGVLGGQELERLRTVTSRQQAVAGRAAAAVRAAADAAQQAKAATLGADRLLDAQRAVLLQVQTEQLKTVGSAQATRDELQRSKNADAQAAAAMLSAALQSRRSGTPVPIDPDQCQGLRTDGYANGEIPAAALCPVWGAPGQLLRGDAARAFTALSRQYAKAFGTPICVTDSYRSRSQQVVLYATKPNLAARPGTSNHGWGTAADLCGGVESFGTAEHAWLLSHAPLYGWFHPSWAQPSGSRPEPWHWEFAG
jgi:zinc D-Ala-D-Ala carboxypeptidase